MKNYKFKKKWVSSEKIYVLMHKKTAQLWELFPTVLGGDAITNTHLSTGTLDEVIFDDDKRFDLSQFEILSEL